MGVFSALQVMDRKDAIPQCRCLAAWVGSAGAGTWELGLGIVQVRCRECGVWDPVWYRELSCPRLVLLLHSRIDEGSVAVGH